MFLLLLQYATNLTEAGYVGEDVDSMISVLLARADGRRSKSRTWHHFYR